MENYYGRERKRLLLLIFLSAVFLWFSPKYIKSVFSPDRSFAELSRLSVEFNIPLTPAKLGGCRAQNFRTKSPGKFCRESVSSSRKTLCLHCKHVVILIETLDSLVFFQIYILWFDYYLGLWNPRFHASLWCYNAILVSIFPGFSSCRDFDFLRTSHSTNIFYQRSKREECTQ